MRPHIQNTNLFFYSLSKTSFCLSQEFKNLSSSLPHPPPPVSLVEEAMFVWGMWHHDFIKSQEFVVCLLKKLSSPSLMYEACWMGQGPVLYSLIAICWWVSITGRQKFPGRLDQPGGILLLPKWLVPQTCVTNPGLGTILWTLITSEESQRWCGGDGREESRRLCSLKWYLLSLCYRLNAGDRERGKMILIEIWFLGVRH